MSKEKLLRILEGIADVSWWLCVAFSVTGYILLIALLFV